MGAIIGGTIYDVLIFTGDSPFNRKNYGLDEWRWRKTAQVAVDFTISATSDVLTKKTTNDKTSEERELEHVENLNDQTPEISAISRPTSIKSAPHGTLHRSRPHSMLDNYESSPSWSSESKKTFSDYRHNPETEIEHDEFVSSSNSKERRGSDKHSI